MRTFLSRTYGARPEAPPRRPHGRTLSQSIRAPRPPPRRGRHPDRQRRSPFRPVTHVATGGLYGLKARATTPADSWSPRSGEHLHPAGARRSQHPNGAAARRRPLLVASDRPTRSAPASSSGCPTSTPTSPTSG